MKLFEIFLHIFHWTSIFPFLEDYLCDAIEYNLMIFVESEKKDTEKKGTF